MRRAILLPLLLAACGGSEPAHPNVLIVTIDTLRADAVGAGTPAINGFFSEATRFRATRTVAPLTLPAHSALFTGLHPARNGMHDNVNEPLPPRDKRSFPLLAEQFKDAGYATAGFVARAVLAGSTGIGGGFDVYDFPASEAEWQDEGGSIPAEERIRTPLAWIEGVPKGKPWFVWVHLFDPHAPYFPFKGDALRAPTREGDSDQALYAGEVRRADAAVEKLLKAVGPDTVIVLASDHGEGLMDHGEATHGPLCYGTTIDVVLAIRAPGFAPGAEDKGLRSIMDVTPTLRRLCGLPKADADGRDLAGPPHETLVAESLFTWSIHGWGQVFAVTDGEFSLIEAGSSVELYDRRKDHGETTPVPINVPAYEKLDRALERFRSATKGGGAGGDLVGSVPPYGELRRRDTGYLSRRENAKLLNPEDHLGPWAMLEGIVPLVRVCSERKDPVPLTTCLKTIDEIQKHMPASPRVDHYRACVQAALGEITGVTQRYSEAAWSELAAIEKGYIQEETIVPAITYCVAASDAEALRTLVRLLNRWGRRLDPAVERSLADALKKLGVTEELFLVPPIR